MSPVVLFTLIVLVAIVVGDQVLRRHVANKLTGLYARGQYDELLDYLGGTLVSLCYPRYNRDYMRANALEQSGRAEEAVAQYRELLAAKCTDEQRKDLIAKAFVAFLEQGHNDDACALLPEIADKCDEGFSAYARTLYDVMANHSHAYLEQMKAELPEATGLRRMQLHYLLACQYRNVGDQKSAAEHEVLASEELQKLAQGAQT